MLLDGMGSVAHGTGWEGAREAYGTDGKGTEWRPSLLQDQRACEVIAGWEGMEA